MEWIDINWIHFSFFKRMTVYNCSNFQLVTKVLDSLKQKQNNILSFSGIYLNIEIFPRRFIGFYIWMFSGTEHDIRQYGNTFCQKNDLLL